MIHEPFFLKSLFFIVPSQCAPNPCQNDGICVLDGDAYQCKCQPGYGGKNCNVG